VGAADSLPLLPELSVVVNPPMVSTSGKAPIDEDSDASAAAAAFALAAAASDAEAGGKGSSGRGSSSKAAAAAGQMTVCQVRQAWNLSRQWRPVFHPSFTILGTQPQILLPQVGGC